MARITNALRHTHKYFRMPSTGLWYCAGIDGCTHYMPKNMPEPVGRMSICWQCEREFKLIPVNMLENEPICDTCSERRAALDDVINDMDTVVKEKNPYAGFGSKNALEQLRKRGLENVKKAEEPEDKIEVYDDEGGHAADCAMWSDGECNCK